VNSLLLVHPPVAKPCEPPAGIAKLSGALSYHHVSHGVADFNLECLLALLREKSENTDVWTARAQKNSADNIDALKSWKGYVSIDLYRRAVSDLHRLFHSRGSSQMRRLTFSDFQHPHLSPVKSSDLLWSAEHFDNNIFYPYFSKRLQDLFKKIGYGFIGFSLNYLSQAICTFAMVGFIKKMVPEVKVVLGGSLVTSWIRGGVWKNQFDGLIDHVIAGQGELPLLAMLGIDIKNDRSYCPSFEFFQLQKYFSPGPILPYSASTGCYWSQCAFCPEKAEGTHYQPISKDIIAGELNKLSAKTQAVLIHLVDNALSPAMMAKLSANPPDIPWYGFARLTKHLSQPDFCQALSRSGCVMLKLGLESGSQKVLDSMHKGNTLECSSAALQALKKAGIGTYVYVLFGTPWETEIEANETLQFVANHSPYIDFLNIAVFNLPVNSPDASRLQTAGFYEGDLSLYTNFAHPDGWDRKHVKQFLDKKFRRNADIQSILRRHPPGFGSNHAPLFVMKNTRQKPVK
jgi:radical SAM superfamily enzyme YgiQ (UPF0313 family)